MNELLIELFSEEIPARMQINAANQLLTSIETKLSEQQIKYSKTHYFVTPRRLFFCFEGISSEVPATTIERKGPKTDAKEEAINGFLKSVGLEKNDLKVIDGFFYAIKEVSAKPTGDLLKLLIEQVLISFTWPKSIRIGDKNSRTRWVRPLRNILCMFGKQVLDISFAGINSNNFTYGHRFMAPEKIEISSFTDYKQKLETAFVVLSSEERKNLIINKAQSLADKLNLKVALDTQLLNEVVGLVEFPNILLGKIDSEFMHLPKEALTSVMKNHQRYFYLEDSNGNIAPYFIVVANVKRENDNLIIEGNEKVLRARFADAKFFLDQDLKTPISANLAKLAKMTFHHKLGNMFEKVNRIIELSQYISNNVPNINSETLHKSALLCKIDLVSEMVGEFPELQGIMGGYYVSNFGEDSLVSDAITNHYRPKDTEDRGEISIYATIVAISDKIDSIVGLWIAGEKPTSSKDPFALRRAAIGIIKLLRHHKINISLKDLINFALKQFSIDYEKEAQKEIFLFFNERLKYFLKAENYRHDLISSSLSENSDNIFKSIEKLQKLQNYITSDNSTKLIFSIKRILNILSSSKEQLNEEVNIRILNKSEEKLFNEINKITSVESCDDLEVLTPLIDEFFENTLVNDPEQNLRLNRLNLLSKIANLSKQVADFNLIEA